jgi:SPP1 family predicted phage head-tail adaptor
MVVLEEMMKQDFKYGVEKYGVNITVRNFVESGKDQYGQPTHTTTDYNLKALKETLGMRDARFVEAGFLPEHYLVFFIPYDDVSFTFNVAKDEITYAGEKYIIRVQFVHKVGDVNIFYKLLCRRVEVK